MLENADKKIKKDYNKIGTEDDPLIIAQRFLNIFRQLHIFTDERKQAFNKMILEQPAEIRGMFSSLPGGAVLQQYVDDLEAKHGIIRSIPDAAPQVDYEEEAKAKILATALAEANNQSKQNDGQEAALLAAQIKAEAEAKAAAEAQARLASQAAAEAKAAAAKAQEQLKAQTQAFTQLQDLLKNKISQAKNDDGEKISPKAIFQPISSTVTADEGFAREIASAIKEAISETDDSRKKDSQEITKAIIESQNKLAEIMAQNNSANIEAQNRLAQMMVQNNTANNASNANNIQINTAATFPPVEEMINGIVKVQSELFKEMAKTQTSELSAIISLALKESQQLSTQSIITALKEMQKENLKFLQMHPVVYSNRSDTTVAPKEKIDNSIDIKINDEKNNSDAVLSEVENNNDDVLREVGIANTPVVDETEAVSSDNEEPSQKKKKKKKKKKKNQDGISLDGVTSALLNKVSSLTDKVTSLTSKFDDKDIAEESHHAKTTDEESSYDKFVPISDENPLDLSLFDDSEAQKSSIDFMNKTEEKPDENQDLEWEYEEVPPEEILDHFALDTTDENSENLITDETSQSEGPARNDIFQEEDTINKPKNFNKTETEETQDPSQFYETVSEEDVATPKSFEISNNIDDNLPQKSNYDEVSAEETEASSPIETIENIDDENSNKELSNEGLSEFETESTETLEKQDNSSDENQDWEWDYEEVPEGETEASEALEAQGNSSDENQDWEWDYEEVPEEKEPESQPITLNLDDPYHLNQEAQNEEVSPLSAIYGSEVYFHDKVYQNHESDDDSPLKLPENLTDDFSLSHLDGQDEKDDPYKPKTTI